MTASLARVPLGTEQDVFVARQRAREAARALGFDTHDEVRVATAVSELGRAVVTVGHQAVVLIGVDGVGPPELVIEVTAESAWWIDESSPQAAALDAGRRLMDSLVVSIDPPTIRMAKIAAGRLAALKPAEIEHLRQLLVTSAVATPFDELRAQNLELMATLDQLRSKQDELVHVNQELAETNQGVLAMYSELSSELEDTNRGVVALYAELDERTLQLRDASEAKSRFLASVSHELRSPVNSVVAVARFLLEPDSEPLTGSQSHQVGLIISSAEELLARVNELLDLAKAESGKLRPEPACVDLDALLSDLRASMRPLAADGVELLVENTGLPPFTVETDATLLSQLLRNLISNALKYTERGEVRLTTRPDLSANSVSIRVTDSGIGIAPEHHQLVFEEFFQVPGKHQVGKRSTGLGLAYVRRVAEALGATIELESEIGVGSTFQVTLPMQWLRSPLVSPGATTDPMTKVRYDTVLIVDDEPGFRQLLRQMLQGAATRVVEADDSESAIRLMREVRPDLVLLDLRMPAGDGEEVLVRATIEDDLKSVPIAVITSVDLDTEPERRLSRAFAVVSKAGLTQESLLAKVRTSAGSGEAIHP